MLEKTLNSKQKLQALIQNEIKSDAEKYGDKRRSPLVARTQAQAMSETEVLPVDPVTVILSQKGWVRAAKGHEIDAENVNYKAGDELLMATFGKSNQQAIFVDSTGRSYSLLAHSLPSARGQGEPLTGRLNPPPGSQFVGALMGQDEELIILASDAGYGFVTQLSELHCKNRNGKAVIKPPKNSLALAPQKITDLKNNYLVVVTTGGYMLLFPIADLPQLARGKGNKIINIPSSKVSSREEIVAGIAVIAKTDKLTLSSGKRHLELKFSDLKNYLGERTQRGTKLPKGLQKIDKIMVNNP
jgi:topoisomerase-4 subunit A